MEEKRSLIRKVLHIGLIVKDLQKSMEYYWKILGIGPWHIYTLKPPFLVETYLRGKKVSFSMKLAIAEVGNLHLELIQPLSGESVYESFLKEKGEGIHHIGCEIENYDEALEYLNKKGIGILMGGVTEIDAFAYLDTEDLLGTVIEINKRPKDFKMPPPEATYP